MANKKGRRHFGNVRKLPSGRFQASYLGLDGIRRNAPETFPDKTSAQAWLTMREADLMRGEWTDPDLGKVLLNEYGDRWIREHKISDLTRELYETLFRLHIKPYLGDRELARITPEVVRRWRSGLLSSGRSEITTAKSYRLLRAMMNTAVDDERIRRNPCRIKGADKEYSPERPVATASQVYALADVVQDRFRGLILAAAFTGLRWGELIGLRRMDVDLDNRTIRVPRRLAQLRSGQLVAGPPKSEAGLRTVTLPALLVPELARHLDEYVGAGATALLFTGEKGAPLKRGNWRRTVDWPTLVHKVGLPDGFHFHDLRHTGNHLATQAGASTKDLMHRMGHSSMRAALRYQHANDERARHIADRLDELVQRDKGDNPPDDEAAEGA